MLGEVDAVRFDRSMTNGRTKPMLIACERESGEEIEVIAKFSFGCDKSVDGLIRESFAAMLAKDVGLPVPEPVVVHASNEFIDSIGNPEVVNYLKNSVPVGFGSRKLPDGFSVWTHSSARLPQNLVGSALEIFAFDCLLTNGDRRVSNPNLLFGGNTFAIFDHELTFYTNLNIGWVEPWRQGSLTGFNAPTMHVFFESLKGGKDFDLSRLTNAFKNITDDRIAEYGCAIPSAWHDTNGVIPVASQLIANLRDNMEPAVQEVMRALS